MRKLVILVVGFELLALTACGYTLSADRELMGELSWAREFKAGHPQQARAFARACQTELTAAGYSRDGALKLFACMRREAQAQGLA